MLYQPRNILVTGGAGFIGANFVRHIVSALPQARIINLDLLTYAGSLDHLKDLPDNHCFYQGDICDSQKVSELLRKYSIDTIVHFAAESHVDRSISGPSEFIRTNLLGTFTLLESARHYWKNEKQFSSNECRFHHISTDEVYGSLLTHEPAFSESSKYFPNSPYSASKAGSDHLVRAYFHTYGLPVTTSHCSNNYGPFQHAEKFIPTVIRACINGHSIPIYGNGTNIRDWLYVEDHCRAILSIIQQGRLGEVYNIGGNNEWTNLNIAKKICELFDELNPQKKPHENLITFVTDRQGHDFRYAIDMKRIQSELNWQPTETFESGIRKTLKYYL